MTYRVTLDIRNEHGSFTTRGVYCGGVYDGEMELTLYDVCIKSIDIKPEHHIVLSIDKEHLAAYSVTLIRDSYKENLNV